jgi:hypothetical protein
MEHDFSLFPKNEEWGTGDEALDQKLNLALKKAQSEFTMSAVAEFNELANGLNRRAYNPSFLMLIELVTKALLHLQNPGENVYDQLNKMKGHYSIKERVVLDFPEQSKILSELVAKKHYRYNGQLDFSVHEHSSQERNPFLKDSLFRGDHTLNVKIIFKDLKNYLNGEVGHINDNDPLLAALSQKNSTVFIDRIGEIWYDQGHIFALSLIS